ncbi:ribbon-helix-helix protein, CopG family [Rugamonas sp.]|uniref:ribbon-helix-helix protein, CopG family n=1 Tax=Rugamonas sp. TaxID=1926287 RepID=UPI0025E1AD32|nr:ribbon-helix-helix protein, CopG family [Rugamonas sp.]
MNTKKRSAAVRVSLDMSPEANDLLENLASAHGTTKSQILRRAVALYHVASEAKARGNRIAVIDQDKKVVTEVVGL